jgi:prephenate dehydratase
MTAEIATAAALSVGLLGDHRTFAGQAFSELAQDRAGIEPSHANSLAELWARLDAGDIDALLTTAETARRGPQEGYRRILEAPRGTYFVTGEVTVPYRCQLLGKRGSKISHLNTVIGHGSLRECYPALGRLAPNAKLIVTSMSTIHAAQEVQGGDGTTAVVGTRRLAEELGLDVLAADVDEGSEGLWWLIARAPRPAKRANRLVVRLPLGAGHHTVGYVVEATSEAGWEIRTIYSCPGLQQLFAWECLVVLTGNGQAEALQAALGGRPDIDIAGAFRATSTPQPSKQRET